jgi:putative oxidoreductase
MMFSSRSALLSLAGRVLMSAIFLSAGWSKLMAPAGTIQYIAHSGLPVPELSYAVSLVVELGGGLAILLGLEVVPASLALALFCVVTGFVFHLDPASQGQMVNFWKNIAMAGGFLTIAANGAGAWSLDARRGTRRVVATA